MKDQNQIDQNKDVNNPISSGVAPGPGEHLIDASSQPSIASSTPGDSMGAMGSTAGSTTGSTIGSAGRDATSMYGSRDSDTIGNASRSSRASTQGARERQYSPYDTATSGNYDSTGDYQSQNASGTMLQSAASQLRGSRGAFLAGTVVAGFLLQRFLQSSPAKKSGQGYSTYTSDASSLGYGADSSLGSERTYGVDTAYSPDGSYDTNASTGTGASSTGTINRLTERVKQATDTARTKLQSTTAGAKSRLSDVGHTTKTQYYRAHHRVNTVKDEQPLLIGALGIAVGAGLGAMLAVTQRENELLGGVRDNLMGKAKEIASTQMQTVKESAQRFTEIAKEQAQRTKDELAASVSQSVSQSGAKTGDMASSDGAKTTGRNIH